MLFYIYARKSVVSKRGESIQNQIDWAKKYIEANFAEDSNKQISVYKDEGFSGKNLVRPDFQRMMEDAQRQKPNYILCYRLDRISRSVSDFSNLIEELGKKQIGFICQQGNLNTKDFMGKAILLLSSVFAQLERETIAERVRDNMLALAEKGRWLGGTPPTGYVSEKVEKMIVEGKIKTSCKLKPCEEELMIVKRIYDLYRQKRAVSAVAKLLVKDHIVSRSGNYYTNVAIKDILRNPVYCVADASSYEYFSKAKANVCIAPAQLDGVHGLLAYNKRNYTGDHITRNPLSEWIISVGQHQGLIPGDQWVMIQNMLTHKKGSCAASKEHNDYSLLSGFIRCHACGQRMFAVKRHSQHGSFDYICKSKLHGGISLCSMQNLNGRQTDALVCEQVKKKIAVSSDIIDGIAEVREKFRKADVHEEISKWNRELLNCQKKIDNLIKLLEHDDIKEATFQNINRQVEELSKHQKKLAKKKEMGERALKEYRDETYDLTRIIAALSSVQQCFDQFSLSDQRLLIKAAVDTIDWDGTTLTIAFFQD